MKLSAYRTLTLCTFLCGAVAVTAQDLQLNDLGYFERQGVNVLVYSNNFNGGFNDEKNSGIEIIHHGVRTVQGGAVRLNNTPEQWDLVPKTTSRKVERDAQSIEVGLRYDDYDFDSRVVVTAKGKAVEIAVYLDKPLPEFLVGKAGFNIEFLPSQYWQKTFIMDGRLNRFPRYAVSQTVTVPNAEKPRQFKGFRTYDDRGTNRFVDPLPMETGHEILLASDAPERMIRISSEDAELRLYDGRMLAQNGWYVLRSVIPANKTGKVITWTVEPHAVPNWIREPNIGFSQVGYIPEQRKVAVIELDKKDVVRSKASLVRIKPDGVPDILQFIEHSTLNPVAQAEHIGHMFSKDEIYRVANWLFGCHPYHNYSFVAAVGAARPKAVFYGNNRADFSFIPGNVAPGLLFRQPDHFENFDDWPFLWGQNECTIAGNTQYVIFGSAFKNLVNSRD